METNNNDNIPPIPGVEPEKEVNIPPVPGVEPESGKSASKKVWWIVAIAAVVLAGILALVLTKCGSDKAENATERRIAINAPEEEPSTQSNVTVRTYTGAEADSMMRAEMAHMDSMMNEMMNDPFFTGGLGAMLDPFQDPTQPARAPQQARQPRQVATNGVVTLAGNVGGRGLNMKLDLRDPQNVTGTGSWADGGKLTMLGIGNGSELDVSLYEGSKLLGTLSGEWRGGRYRGVYLQDGKEASFSLLAQ